MTDVIKTETGRWRLDCGCVLVAWEIYDGKYNHDCDIHYCSRHAAADALHEALKWAMSLLEEEYGNGIANGYWPDIAEGYSFAMVTLALVDKPTGAELAAIADHVISPPSDYPPEKE